MGKIYSPPPQFTKPEFDFSDIEEYNRKEDQYVQSVKDWAKKNGKGKYAGDTIRFPVADGYAMYVVFSLNPVILIHLPIGDEWQFEYAHRLTAGDIKEKAEQEKKMEELFSSKKKEQEE